MHAKVKGAGCGDGLLGLVELSPSFAKQDNLLLARVVAHPKHSTYLPGQPITNACYPVQEHLSWYPQ